MDMHSDDDERTVLYGQYADEQQERLTDSTDAHLFENLEQRLMYSARLAPEKRLDVHLNPLVAAASDLLVQLARLVGGPAVGDVRPLNRQLVEQIKLFEAHAHRHGIEHDQMLAARYVLCTVLDEAVLTSVWGNSSDWSTMSLLSRFHKETFGGEKFFQLLERLGSNPQKHLPMLELMYLCLALGFEGKYRVTHRGDDELDGIRDGLYRQIRQLRGDMPRTLSPQWRGLQEKHGAAVRPAPSWLVLLFTLITLTVMYSGFAWVLGKQRDAVIAPYQFVDAALPKPQSQNRETP